MLPAVSALLAVAMLATTDPLGEGAELTVRLGPVPEARYSAGQFPLYVVFTNASQKPLRLLNQFDPIPVFFSFRLTRPDETLLALPGAGKADFPAGALTYVVLAPAESITIEVDLARLLPSDAELLPGTYRVAVTYHNQYGRDCYQGQASSQPITLQVAL